MDIFDNISPIDFRYYGRNKEIFNKLQPYLSENAMIAYMCKVEEAIAGVLAKRKVCSQNIYKEISSSCKKVKAEDVYLEEDRIKHNVRALVNVIRKNVSNEAKPFVHLSATSHDIICTSDAARYKDCTSAVILPSLMELEKTLIKLALREKDTLQIGRTHGQHAEPITFGFAMAEYVSRLGNCILKIKMAGNNLRGKVSGAVGAYNASSLFFADPESFEKEVLAELELKPSTHSTQIAEPEFMTDYIHSIISCFGVLANLADDMRHLQRSEIAEIGEVFEGNQVGSSTMPHKRNPINFENVKSMWKAMMPRMITLYEDQISEHQRDLTNSASSRFTAEIIAGFVASVERMNKVMSKIVVDKDSLARNFNMGKDMIAAEPAYIMLAAHGHPDAHEHIRQLTLKAQKEGKPFQEVFFGDLSIAEYLKKLNKAQSDIIRNPEKYKGIASQKAAKVCETWRKELKL